MAEHREPMGLAAMEAAIIELQENEVEQRETNELHERLIEEHKKEQVEQDEQDRELAISDNVATAAAISPDVEKVKETTEAMEKIVNTLDKLHTPNGTHMNIEARHQTLRENLEAFKTLVEDQLFSKSEESGGDLVSRIDELFTQLAGVVANTKDELSLKATSDDLRRTDVSVAANGESIAKNRGAIDMHTNQLIEIRESSKRDLEYSTKAFERHYRMITRKWWWQFWK